MGRKATTYLSHVKTSFVISKQMFTYITSFKEPGKFASHFENVESPSLEIFKTCVDVVLCSLP